MFQYFSVKGNEAETERDFNRREKISLYLLY